MKTPDARDPEATRALQRVLHEFTIPGTTHDDCKSMHGSPLFEGLLHREGFALCREAVNVAVKPDADA